MVADAHLREPAADERPHVKLRYPGCACRRGERLERFRRLRVLLRLVKRLGAHERSFEPRALVARDAAREEARVDPEAVGEPLDRAFGRARLAALDLRDVLLGEAVAGEIGLRQPGGNAELAEPFPKAKSLGAGSASCAAGGLAHRHVSARSSQAHTSLKCNSGGLGIPHLSVFIAKLRSTMRSAESLDRAT